MLEQKGIADTGEGAESTSGAVQHHREPLRAADRRWNERRSEQGRTPEPYRPAVISLAGFIVERNTMARHTQPTSPARNNRDPGSGSTPRRRRPAWAAEYRTFDAWTQDEFRNLLCGLAPVRPQDAPVRAQKEAADAFVRDELCRVAADRRIRDAIIAGNLTVLDPPDDRLLEKIRPHVTSEELEALRRTVAHDRSCAKAYRVAPDVAIRWATSRPDLFPDFLFAVEDLAGAEANGRPANPAGKTAESKSRTSGVNAAPPHPAFPNRAAWLRAELDARNWTVHDLATRNGPTWKTGRKILEGQVVRETAVVRTARALSETKRVSRDDVPND